ncbi:hypothetical protein THAOC_02492 [Thalassiosira oceanica]|uniref:Uncharacterized protein n=1 Tax=Thalassiosira oceanica TaxID=159749 RepID=K0TEG6_THAOC|nr:hypothetical protein THAOC_02492 [Thalassiosira oceanica]|eukprot:EJK75775.1 hypothetical protein THAOC_02492 [Thalassiosira oceanica]
MTRTRLSSSTTTTSNEICETTVNGAGNAEVLCTAVDAAKKFTVTQRQKLDGLGLLNVKRKIRIIGTPLSECNVGNCVIDGEEKKDDDGPFGDNDDDTKVIHFQRHGQGYHNLICDIWRETGKPIDFDSPDPNLNPVVRPEFCDPPLTALGNAQCSSQRPLCSRLTPELIIVSPMLRCIQTAKLSFRDHKDIKWVSHEGCREELGLLQGNKRRSITEIREDYPEIDFSAIEFDHDKIWEDYGDRELFGTRDLLLSRLTCLAQLGRETLKEKGERIYKFLTEYVRERPEKEIAIVCHSAYLFTLLNSVMEIEEEQLRSWFLTSGAELGDEIRGLLETTRYLVESDRWAQSSAMLILPNHQS